MIPALIAAGASLIGSSMASNASKSAANTQLQAGREKPMQPT